MVTQLSMETFRHIGNLYFENKSFLVLFKNSNNLGA